jgi:peroxiredoxin
MRKQWLMVIGIVILLAAGAYALVSSAPPRIEVGVRAPDYVATDLATGKPVSILSLHPGDVTLVNIWATWCEPCKDEIPAMDSLYRDLGPRGFHIVAVSIDQGSPETVKSFAQQYHMSFDVLQDRSTEIQSTYQTTGVPESFLVNKQGRIVRIIRRGHPWNSPASRAIISELLANPAS